MVAQNPEELEGKIKKLRNKQKPPFFSYLSVKSQEKTYENGPRIPKPACQLAYLPIHFQKFHNITQKIQKNLSYLHTRNSKSLQSLNTFLRLPYPNFKLNHPFQADPRPHIPALKFHIQTIVQTLVQWCLINHFFYQVKKQMLNPYTMAFQPYYFIQSTNNDYPQFLFHDQAQLLFSTFGQLNPIQNGIFGPAQPSEPIRSGSGNNVVANTVRTNETPTLIQNNSQKGHIIKEKIIKKPANRPATYLTQKKYYLAQTLDQESNSNRRLRPRKIKKRSRDGCKAVIISEQAELSPKDRLKDYVTKGDIGSSEDAEEFCKKKDEKSSSNNEEGYNSNNKEYI